MARTQRNKVCYVHLGQGTAISTLRAELLPACVAFLLEVLLFLSVKSQQAFYWLLSYACPATSRSACIGTDVYKQFMRRVAAAATCTLCSAVRAVLPCRPQSIIWGS
jgi:hypothetical protein